MATPRKRWMRVWVDDLIERPKGHLDTDVRMRIRAVLTAVWAEASSAEENGRLVVHGSRLKFLAECDRIDLAWKILEAACAVPGITYVREGDAATIRWPSYADFAESDARAPKAVRKHRRTRVRAVSEPRGSHVAATSEPRGANVAPMIDDNPAEILTVGARDLPGSDPSIARSVAVASETPGSEPERVGGSAAAGSEPGFLRTSRRRAESLPRVGVPSIDDMVEADFRDLERFDVLWQQAVARGWGRAEGRTWHGELGRVEWFATREYCYAKRRRLENPIATFARLARRGERRGDPVEEARAARAIRTLDERRQRGVQIQLGALLDGIEQRIGGGS